MDFLGIEGIPVIIRFKTTDAAPTSTTPAVQY